MSSIATEFYIEKRWTVRAKNKNFGDTHIQGASYPATDEGKAKALAKSEELQKQHTDSDSSKIKSNKTRKL